MSKSIRFTFFLHSSNFGGAELSTLELLGELVQRGNRVNCIVPGGENLLVEMLRKANVGVHLLPIVDWWTADPLLAIEQSKHVASILGRLESDLIVTITGVIPQAAIAAKNLGIPHIWCLHEYLDKDHGLKIPFSLEVFSEFILQHSEKVICNSRSVRDHFFPEKQTKIEVIYPYPLSARLLQKPKQLNLGKPQKLGLIANFSPGKGHLLLLDALVILQKSNVDMSVTFFGESGSESLRAKILTFLEENSLLDSVRFAGFLQSKKEIFESIDVVVVPSVSEAFGRVPFEAMAFGKPVIYSDSGALPEYMVPGKTGIPFEANNAQSLADGIQFLIQQDFERMKIIDNGWSYVNQIYDSESYVGDFLQICDDAKLNFVEAGLEDSVSVLIGKYLELTQQRDELTQQRDELTQQRDELTQQRDELTQQRDELTQQRDELVNSTIWKLTNPLRIAINHFKN